ncbi:hypothetical protein [Streptomyces sp. ISL-43]|uniref:hypothetical protein n=1 Tax=Streptomyces sp. ISL-43 TaxID=2819183 RepID=UPI00203565E7|nr:hypothetical protein [Streptomyces sp. ISL-43]
MVLAAGTALVGAMATDGWQQARAATVALWRRVHPDSADPMGAELDALRARVLAAREEEDEDTERALAGTWRLHLQQLLRADPDAGLSAELRRLLDEHLAPLLAADERSRVGSIVMTAEAHDNARVFMAGRDQHITGE